MNTNPSSKHFFYLSSNLSKAISKNSKKIKKTKKSSKNQNTPSQESGSETSKYRTFGNSEKRIIISSLKEALIKSQSLDISQISTSQDLLDFLDQINVNTYTQVLEKILTKYVRIFIAS